MRLIPSQARLGTFLTFGVVGIALVAAISMAVWPRREMTPQDLRYLDEFFRASKSTSAIWPDWAPGDCDVVICKPRRQYLVTRRPPREGASIVLGMTIQGRRVYALQKPVSPWPVFGTDRPGDRVTNVPTIYLPDYETQTSSHAAPWEVESRLGLREALAKNLFLEAFFRRRLYEPPFIGEEGYVSSMFHLAFHLFAGLGPEGHAQGALGMRPVDPLGPSTTGLDPVAEREYQRAKHLEHRHLFQAIQADDAWERAVEARLFLRSRSARYGKLPADRRDRFVTSERFSEWQEGLAAYTEYRVHQLASAGMMGSEPSGIVWDVDVQEPSFLERMEVGLRFDELRARAGRAFESATGEADTVAWHRDAYIVGLGLSLLLDHLLPGWSTECLEKGTPHAVLLERAVGTSEK